MNTIEIEEALYRHFSFSRYACIPNAYLGLGFNHELDMLCINKNSLYATEVEIKISKSDILADKRKQHKHFDKRLKYLYFAVPANLIEYALKHIPETAGLLAVVTKEHKEKYSEKYFCIKKCLPLDSTPSITVVRKPKQRRDAKKFTYQEYVHALELASGRLHKMTKKLISKKDEQ